jgi:hypothetical protein
MHDLKIDEHLAYTDTIQICKFAFPLNWEAIEAMGEDDGLKAMGQVIQIGETGVRDHPGEIVRGNDQFDHPAGDETLRAFAINIFANIRTIDKLSP